MRLNSDPVVRDDIITRSAEKVVFWGDSITNPFRWFDVLLWSIYGEFDHFGQTRPNFLNVGINGTRYRDWLDPNNRTHFVDPYLDAKAAIVLLGVNDVLQQPPTPDDEFEADVGTFYDYLQQHAPDMRLLVMSPWLIGATRPNGCNAKDAELDRKRDIVARICGHRGIPFVDLRTAWFNDDQVDPLYPDGLLVHPNRIGVSWLGEMARKHIQVRF
jgi:lysophospholipase L1-like esterase